MQAVRHRHSLVAVLDDTVQHKSTGRILRDGIVVGVSNPKAIVFFAVAAGAARARIARSPKRLELVGGAGGLVMMGIGASLALTGRKD